MDSFTESSTRRGKHYVYWMGSEAFRKSGASNSDDFRWGEITGSKPFPVKVTAWQGPNAGDEVELETEARGAMETIACGFLAVILSRFFPSLFCELCAVL